MAIRLATPDDAAALARVHVDSWRAAYCGLVPDSRLRALNYERGAQTFGQWLARGDSSVYAIEEAGTVVGFCTLGPSRDSDVDPQETGEIWGIYLAPEHWRKGFGSALCRNAERTLKEQGRSKVILWVFEGNERARRFYEAMGFAADGASKVLNVGVPLKAVRYRKDIGEAKPRRRT